MVAKLRGLLCFCFFKTSAHMRTAPWDPGSYTYAVIAFEQCPPSIEEATKIKSPNLFQVESNKMRRDVKGLFLGVRSVSEWSHHYKLVRLQLEDELLVQKGCSVRGVCHGST